MQEPNREDYLAFESGRMTPDQEADFFQRLVDSGQLDTLSARYERRAQDLIEKGLVYA